MSEIKNKLTVENKTKSDKLTNEIPKWNFEEVNKKITKIKEKEYKQKVYDFLKEKITPEKIELAIMYNDKIGLGFIIDKFLQTELKINSETNLSINYMEIALEYALNNKKILNLIVENGRFDIFGVCPPDEIVKRFKEKYKQSKINQLKNLIDNYTTKDGKKLKLNDIISNEKYKPLVLYEKLEQLVDKNGKALTKEKIKQILSSVKKIKKLSIEDKFYQNFQQIDKNKLKNYLNFLQENGKFILKVIKENSKLDNNYLLDIANSYGINIDKNKEKFIALSINFINTAKPISDILLEKQEKEIEKKLKNKKIEKIDLQFTKGKDTKIPSVLLADKDFSFYVNLIRQHNGILNFIVSKLSKYVGQNSKFLTALERFIDENLTNEKDAHSGLEKIRKFIERGKKIPFIGKIFEKIHQEYDYNLENFQEEEYFLKEGKLLNTNYIWLYSNNPDELKKYNGEKAPNLPGRNQVCKREDFIKILKTTPIEEINYRGLTDYFLKSKMMYGDRETAILKISQEIGIDKIKEILQYHHNGHINDKSLKNLFKELNKQFNFDDILNFKEFEEKETTINDLKIIKNNFKNGLFNKKIQEIQEEITTGSLDNTKAYNLIATYVNKHKEIEKGNDVLSSSLNSDLFLYINKILEENNIKLDDLIAKLKKGTEKEKKLAINLGIIIETATTLGVKPTEVLAVPESTEYIKYLFLDPLKAITDLTKGLVNKRKITPEKAKELAIKVAKKFESDTKELSKLFENLKSIKVPELAKKLEGFSPSQKQKLLKIIKDENFSQALNSGDYNQAAKIISSYPQEKRKEIQEILKRAEEAGRNAVNIFENTHKNTFKPGQEPQELQEKVLESAFKKDIENYYKAQAELAKSGFYTEEEKQYIYNNIYYNSFVSQELKEQIKHQAKKDGIPLDLNPTKQQSKSKFIEKNNFDNLSPEEKVKYLLSENNKNIIINYEEKNGIIKIKNPFSNELENTTIEASSIKQANEKLILEYLQSVNFYQADEINFSKDLEKTYQQLGIDLNKPLTLEDIKNFTKNFSWQILFKLENLNNIANIDKKYIQLYKKKFIENPDNINTYLEFIYFLNNKIDLLAKTGIYDYIEKKLNLENLEIDNNSNYREFLKNFK